MQPLQLLFLLPFVQYTTSSPLPNKPIRQIRPYNHYRNHPRSADPSPQFDDPPIYGPGPGDFCDPPTTITVTVPGPATIGGAQLEPVTSTVTVTAKGVDTGLFDGIFGPINIGQSVKPERVITVAMETSTMVLPGSTETVTMRVTGSEVTVTGETSEVTVTVSAQDAGDVPSTITTYPTSTTTLRDAVNTRESMPKLSGKKEDEAAKSEGENFAETPIPSIPSYRSFVHLGGMTAQAQTPTAKPQTLNINPEEAPIPLPLLPQPITYHNPSITTGAPTSPLAPITPTPTVLDSSATVTTEGRSIREFSKISSSAPVEPSINAFGEDVEDLDSHEDIVALAAELGIEQVHHPSGFVPDYAPKKTATLAPPAATTASR